MTIMARERQRERGERLNNPYSEMQKQNMRKLDNKILEGKKTELEKSVEDLARKVVESEHKYGPDHFNTRVLSMFYTVTFSLQNVVGMMFSMKEAMQVLSQTINIMDDTFKFIDEMMSLENYKRYTAWGRHKQRSKIRKFVRMNSNRMKAIMDMIKGYGKIADAMLVAMSSFDKKLKKSMQKKGGKQNDVMAGYQNEAAKQLQKYREEYKAENADSGDDSSAPSAGAGASSGASNGEINIDDIV